MKVGDLVKYAKGPVPSFVGVVIEELDDHRVSVSFNWNSKLHVNQVLRADLHVVASHKEITPTLLE